jgi:hypothetical protein
MTEIFCFTKILQLPNRWQLCKDKQNNNNNKIDRNSESVKFCLFKIAKTFSYCKNDQVVATCRTNS